MRGLPCARTALDARQKKAAMSPRLRIGSLRQRRCSIEWNCTKFALRRTPPVAPARLQDVGEIPEELRFKAPLIELECLPACRQRIEVVPVFFEAFDGLEEAVHRLLLKPQAGRIMEP